MWMLGVVHLEDMPDSAEALETPPATHESTCFISRSPMHISVDFGSTSRPCVSLKDDLHAVWEGIRGELQARLNALDELNQPSKIPGFGRKAKELQKSSTLHEKHRLLFLTPNL